ncbi:hypothetical protein ACWGR4_30880 [Embleya sp. NPDC055664]
MDPAIGCPEEDHPERGLCRAAFVTHRSWVRRLLDDSTLPAHAPPHDDERAGPHTTARP